MSTLYRPVLIESAEQAEALPEGTIAIVGEPPVESSVKWDDRLWYSGRDFDDGAPSRRMVGAMALVPIEAEEEWRASWPEDDAHQRCRDERTARLWADRQGTVTSSRLVTPWESA